MRKQPIAIVLGGTSPHIALIRNLKGRGYYTVLVDYLENPPARNFADEHIRESTLDQDKVLELATDLNAKLVISACVDQANLTACYVAEKLGLPAPYSYETALDVTNKIRMKKKMAESGIPTSRFISVNSEFDYKDIDLRFPVVVKPADSTGSKGVKRVSRSSDLPIHIADAMEKSRANLAIVEEFVEGKEIQIDCFVHDGIADIIMVREKMKISGTAETVLQSAGSIIPADISPSIQISIQKIANDIAESFGLENTPMFIQAVIDNTVNIIEFAPRIGGGLSYRIIEAITGFDILNSVINSYFGQRSILTYEKPKAHYATILLYACPGVLGGVVGCDDLVEKGIIQEFYQLKPNGVRIGADISSQNRVAALLLSASNKQELFKKMETAIEKVEVFDEMGKQILRRDLYVLR